MRTTRIIALAFIAALIFSCRDDSSIVDINHEISARNWSYQEKIKIPVTIDDTGLAYNLLINLRHTPGYKYSNIFLLIHQIGPDGKRITDRKEFQLAYPDGEWLGKGSGNLLSYQLPFKAKHRFSKKGTYVFEIEQNMRDNPLREITDAGLRVEKSITGNP